MNSEKIAKLESITKLRRLPANIMLIAALEIHEKAQLISNQTFYQTPNPYKCIMVVRPLFQLLEFTGCSHHCSLESEDLFDAIAS